SGDCGEGDGTCFARPGAAAGPRGNDSAGKHPEDVERKTAARRNETALPCGYAICRACAGVATDCAAGNGERGAWSWPRDWCWREARPGNTVRRVLLRGVPAVDCADVDDPAFHQGQPRCRALHFVGAEDFVRASGM